MLLVYSLAFITFWTSLCDSTAFCAATSVIVSLSCLTSDELGLRICAFSPRPCLGTLLSPGPFCPSGLVKTSVSLASSSFLRICASPLHAVSLVICARVQRFPPHSQSLTSPKPTICFQRPFFLLTWCSSADLHSLLLLHLFFSFCPLLLLDCSNCKLPPHFCGVSSADLPSFTWTSCRTLSSISVLLCGPSAATPQKALPDFSKHCLSLSLGRPSLFLHSFSTILFALFPPSPSHPFHFVASASKGAWVLPLAVFF